MVKKYEIFRFISVIFWRSRHLNFVNQEPNSISAYFLNLLMVIVSLVVLVFWLSMGSYNTHNPQRNSTQHNVSQLHNLDVQICVEFVMPVRSYTTHFNCVEYHIYFTYFLPTYLCIFVTQLCHNEVTHICVTNLHRNASRRCTYLCRFVPQICVVMLH